MKLTPKFIAKLLKGPNVVLAGSERTALGDGVVEVHGNEISDADEGRSPSSTLDTTVQPIKGSVGTGGRSDLFCGVSRVERKLSGRRREGLTSSTVGSALVILNLDESARVGRCRIALGLVLLGLILLWLIVFLGFVLLRVGAVLVRITVVNLGLSVDW